MKYLSVCSGMEAATVAWHHMGWTPVGFSEIEPFPSAILKHRFPNVPNYGDLTKHDEWPIEQGAIDLLVGGTPCQSFSIAGLRKGLEDPRGNLVLSFLGLADKLKPKWILWENVPGVLSSGKPKGSDFGCFLQGLVELGYGFAYRVLDAQHFGVPQRRRRVFVVACLGDWRAAAEVLSLSEGLRGYIEKGGAKGKGSTSFAQGSIDANGAIGVDFRHERFERDGKVGTIQAKNTGGYSLNYTPGVAIRTNNTSSNSPSIDGLEGFGGEKIFGSYSDPKTAFTLDTTSPDWSRSDQLTMIMKPVAFQPGNLRRQGGANPSSDFFPTVSTDSGDQNPHIAIPPHTIRRLTPRETERLQGFPDDWSRIPWKGKPEEECPDSPRYRACGNSMAVPCMRWIGEKISNYENKLQS
jgi:DNA (cytosine-5)-methyltransferase 1